MRVGIALGSNEGDSHSILDKAVNEIKKIHQTGDFLVSQYHKTEAVDCPPNTAPFINSVLEFGTFLLPLEIFDIIRQLERKYRQEISHGYHLSRKLDIDILYMDDLIINTPSLTVPHPDILNRLFVLIPLAECVPNLRLSSWKYSCQEYLEILIKKQNQEQKDSNVLTQFFISAKKDGHIQKWLTAYDYTMARLLEESGIDVILVGDTLGMLVLGYPDTTSVILADMLHHLKSVVRGVKKTPIIADLPYETYLNTEDAIINATLLIDAGANAVKLEGDKVDIITALRSKNISVIGHLGMLPQQVNKDGGYRKKGYSDSEAEEIKQSSYKLEKAGCSAIVLEMVAPNLAEEISKNLRIPTIGIGSGNRCDGQVLVTYDLLGFHPWFCPAFVRKKKNFSELFIQAIQEFKQDNLEDL